MKKNITLFLLLLSCYGISQVKNSIAIYSVQNSSNVTNNSVKNEYLEKIENSKDVLNDIKIQITFNSNICETKYYGDFKLLTKDQRFATARTGCRYKHFTELKSKKDFYQKDFDPILDAKKNVFYNILDTIWTVTKETKKIQEFTCIKATQIKMKPNGTKYTSTAWFCPEIPFSFGPMQHIGLPGLILELDTDNVLFGLISLELYKNKEDLVIPLAENYLSDKEYFKMAEEMLKELEKNNK